MSLYFEAADLITSLGSSQDTSLKSLLFSRTKPENGKTRKSKPGQLYALITESWKWSSVLKDIIERAGLLSLERKLTPQLALVLVHDLLLAKQGIAAPESHTIRQAVERHKARLRAEFTKARIRSSSASIEEWRTKLAQEDRSDVAVSDGNVASDPTRYKHPRWLRINTLRTLARLLKTEEFRAWKQVGSLEEVLSAQPARSDQGRIYHVDKNIPNLLAFPPGTDLSLLPAYKRGELISQDKASCFPAYLLSSGQDFDGGILDACAAPGNKTSHVAAIVSEQQKFNGKTTNIYATERDPKRSEVLTRMLGIAGADKVKVLAGQDFFKLDTRIKPWTEITAIILDPSCSGSGIVDRGQIMAFDLPTITTASNGTTQSKKSKSKKRKRFEAETSNPAPVKPEETATIEINENDTPAIDSNTTKDLDTRLRALSNLQTKMLLHAFSFPSLTRLTYSTCSIHSIENEEVVIAALSSDIAIERGWRLLERSEQISGMQAWERRGDVQACQVAIAALNQSLGDSDAKEIAEACIRCDAFTVDGTQGFFVAAFVREANMSTAITAEIIDHPESDSNDEEWTGFDD